MKGPETPGVPPTIDTCRHISVADLYLQDDNAPDERVRYDETPMSKEAVKQFIAAIQRGGSDQRLDELLSACMLPEARQVLCHRFAHCLRTAHMQSKTYPFTMLVKTSRSSFCLCLQIRRIAMHRYNTIELNQIIGCSGNDAVGRASLWQQLHDAHIRGF